MTVNRMQGQSPVVRHVLTPIVGAVLPVVFFVTVWLFSDVTGFHGGSKPPETPMSLKGAWQHVAKSVDLLWLIYVAGVIVLAARAVIRRFRGTWRVGL